MDRIFEYLTETLHQTDRAAKRNYEKLTKYTDIREEFEIWIDSNEFPKDGISINGYNALAISELAPFMNGVGVYNFLVTLRDNPEFAMQTILDGFPRK